MDQSFTDLCKKLEHFETPQWAAEAILKREIMTGLVIDPCAGTGILGKAAYNAGYKDVISMDIKDWGSDIQPFFETDFLNLDDELSTLFAEKVKATAFMNPPFSLAEQFVEKCFELGARKVIMFQRFAFWESSGRRPFWDKYPPTKVYVCGERASCWRHDIPQEQRTSGSPTAHAWFIFEKDHKGGTILDRLYKS